MAKNYKFVDQEKLYKLLLAKNYTKAELALIFAVDDRTARGSVAELAYDEPIPSLSTKKGYHIAKDDSDLPDVKHAINQIDSRIRKLMMRRAPLAAFVWERENERKGK